MEWRLVELDRVSQVAGGATPRRQQPEYWGGEIPWVTPTDLPGLGAGIANVQETKDTITRHGLESCSASLLPTGTVLFSSRATIGKVGIAAVPLATNQGFANLIPQSGVDSRYLAWCLFFHADRIAALAGSTTFKEITKGALKRFRIPLPPLSEQRRIVEILDQADRLRRLRAEADAKAERVLPSLFISMFGDPVKNPMRWEHRPLGELTTHITSGSRGWSEYVGHGEDLFIRTQDISDGEISEDLPAVEAPPGAESERTRLEPGDVVVTITGIVGKAAVFRSTPRAAYVSQHVALVRPKQTDLNPDFLASYANLPLGAVPVFARLQYGQTKPGLGFRELAAAQIPHPPILLQRAFAARVETAAALRRQRRKATDRLETLWQAGLKAAFSGNLTAGWREAHTTELIAEMELQAKMLAGVL